MSTRGRFNRLVEELDFVLAEQRHLRQRGVPLIITHREHILGTLCAPGEMIADIAIGVFPEPVSLGISDTSLLLMDCLCRYRMPLTARRVEEIMHTDPFYAQYAANGRRRNRYIARPDRHSVRMYVSRIRNQIGKISEEANLSLHPDRILVSEITDSNVMTYRLKATVSYIHISRR